MDRVVDRDTSMLAAPCAQPWASPQSCGQSQDSLGVPDVRTMPPCPSKGPVKPLEVHLNIDTALICSVLKRACIRTAVEMSLGNNGGRGGEGVNEVKGITVTLFNV